MPRVDVHAHHFPQAYLDCLRRIEGEGRPLDAPGSGLTLEERLAYLDQAGIDLQVLSPGGRMPYCEAEADAVLAARTVNDAYAEVARGFGGRYAAFASVPLPHVEAAIAEAARGLDQLGMLGIALGCSIHERPLDDPAFEPLWAELDRREAVVFLHPIWRATDPHAQQRGLARMVGACFEDSVAALRLVHSGLTERHPGLRIIVPHLGGTLPFILPRLRGLDLRRLHFDTAISHPPALRCACEVLGAGRLMLGSDFPYVPPDGIVRAVSQVQATLSAADAEQILDRTAPALLGML